MIEDVRIAQFFFPFFVKFFFPWKMDNIVMYLANF